MTAIGLVLAVLFGCWILVRGDDAEDNPVEVVLVVLGLMVGIGLLLAGIVFAVWRVMP